MLAGVGLLAAALAASWAPAPKFSLVCSGTQTAYREGAAASRISIPWAETFSIDLGAGTYCSQGCATHTPIAAASSSGLQLDAVTNAEGSSAKSFQLQGGAYSSVEIAGGATSNARFHLEKSGTCTIGP